jgi:uncharacterized membrane protein YebE (DUF533 family)
MDIESLLGNMITGTLLGGGKPSRGASRFLSGGSGSFLNASTLLTLGGLAWGVAETLQQQQASAPAPVPPLPGSQPAPAGVPPLPGAPPLPSGAAPGLAVPPPLPGTTPAAPPVAIPPGAERMVRLMISAARADGELSELERQAILEHARAAGVEFLVASEIDRATPLAAIVAGVADEKQREDLYVLAYAIVRADETVTGSERIYLAQLAIQLGLDDETVARLERNADAGIEESKTA